MTRYPKQYTVTQAMAAVKLDSCIRAHGTVTTLAVGSIITLGGPSLLPGMVEVKWNKDLYAVFDRDLQEKGEPVITNDASGLLSDSG